MLAIDASTSMTHGGVNGAPQVTPLETAVAMTMLTLRTERDCHAVVFSQTVQSLALTAEMSVKQIHDNMVKKVETDDLFCVDGINYSRDPTILTGCGNISSQ